MFTRTTGEVLLFRGISRISPMKLSGRKKEKKKFLRKETKEKEDLARDLIPRPRLLLMSF